MHASMTTLAYLPPLEGCGELLTGCLGKVGALDGLKILPTDFTAPISHSGLKRVNIKLINPFKTRSHGDLNCSLVPGLTKYDVWERDCITEVSSWRLRISQIRGQN